MTKYYSEEEIKAKTQIRKSIIRMVGSKARSTGGTLPCPICQGTIRWHVGRTSHVSAKCNTDGCIEWNETPPRFI